MVSMSKLLHGGLLLVDQLVYDDVAVPQQAAIEQFNVIRHLGGSGPYIQHPGFGIPTKIPEECELEQVQVFARHGERFPTIETGAKFEKAYKKLNAYPRKFKGDFRFFNDVDYEYFVKDPSLYELETSPSNSDGHFSGTDNAFRHGQAFRKKYGFLFNESEVLPLFSSNSHRCFTTSQYFAMGFLGTEDLTNRVRTSILSETANMGANSLTPRKACSIYYKNENKHIVEKYDDLYLEHALERFKRDNPGLRFEKSDVNALFKYCAYELNIKGTSPMCSVFTSEEYIKWSYGMSLSKYYSMGPGHRLSKTVGSVLLEASAKLLKEDNNDNAIWLSFTHDTDLELYLSALGLVEPDHPLDVANVEFPNPYLHSIILPQGARIYTEKYKCSGGKSYVRYVLNDAVIPIPSCSSGPGFSCELNDFLRYVEGRLENTDYKLGCALRDGLPSKVTFFWDYQTVNYTAPLVKN